MSGPFRLLCALLTLLLTLPAMQANACATPAVGRDMAVQAHGSHHGHQDRTPAKPSPETRHDCLGCIPPIDISAYRPVERLHRAFGRTGGAMLTAFPAARPTPPEPPPPRLPV